MRQKQPDSLNSVGYTTISIDRETKNRILALKGSNQVSDFVREMVNDYSQDKQTLLGISSSDPDAELRKEIRELKDTVKSLSSALASLAKDERSGITLPVLPLIDKVIDKVQEENAGSVDMQIA